MKYYSVILFFIVAFNCKGQDSSPVASKNSISVAGGANVIYSTVNQFRVMQNDINSTLQYNYTVKPSNSESPWFMISYSHLLHQSKNLSFWLDPSAGYVQNIHRSTQAGYEYGCFSEINGTFTGYEKLNNLELSLGITADCKLTNSYFWLNGLDIASGIPVFGSGIYNQPFSSPYLNNTDNFSIYTYYKTGIIYRLNKRFSISPIFSIPIINISSLWTKPETFFVFYKELTPYNSVRGGITITYNL